MDKYMKIDVCSGNSDDIPIGTGVTNRSSLFQTRPTKGSSRFQFYYTGNYVILITFYLKTHLAASWRRVRFKIDSPPNSYLL
eukprot:snap_masked-scaffold_2-processed-gene-19.15-mRNA-1 protein AED:1.00 eAED:1.00 QI:0/-1/0/0/-1/1/1/0/81